MKNKALIVIIIILGVLSLALGGYIIYDKLSNKCTKCDVQETKCDVNEEKSETKCSQVTYTEITNDNNGKSKIGGYRFFRGAIDYDEYTIVMFYEEDKNQGFFGISYAAPMQFNNITSGYYKISGNTIEFYQNMDSESDKKAFVRPFGMSTADLYQDSEALKEGYEIQYRLKLNYDGNKISNNNINFNEVTE